MISSRLALSVVLLGAMFSVAEEDLDAALEAQKKQAKRRVYSERALIENRDLVIPKTQSEEEKALDRELERLESQLSSQLTPASEVSVPRMRTPVPVKKENWLTPTLLDPENTDDLSSKQNESSWIGQELERQKTIQMHKKALAEEEALVNKMLREDSRQKTLMESSSFKPYEPTLRSTITPGVTPPASTYSSFNPLGTPQTKENKGLSRTAPLFSPTARANSGVIKPSFSSPSSSSLSSAQKPDWRPKIGSSAPKPISDFSSDWGVSAPLPPLKRVRQSTPINKKNPFDDDFMPDIKTSIWD